MRETESIWARIMDHSQLGKMAASVSNYILVPDLRRCYVMLFIWITNKHRIVAADAAFP
jgi:hypothetical protein